MRLFIADDEPDVLEGMKNILDWKALGFDFCGEATNGVDCLERILALRPDLVLLDIRLPRMLGVEVAERARQGGFSGHIIIISGYSDFEYAKQAMRQGVDHYLLKPVDEEELERAVVSVREAIEAERRRDEDLSRMRSQARNGIVCDLLLGRGGFRRGAAPLPDLKESELDADCWTPALVETAEGLDEAGTARLIGRLLALDAAEQRLVDVVNLHGWNVCLLRGTRTAGKLRGYVDSAAGRTEGWEKRGAFLAVGWTAGDPREVHDSFEAARERFRSRFYLPRDSVCVRAGTLADPAATARPAADLDLRPAIDELLTSMETFSEERFDRTLAGLSRTLEASRTAPEDARGLLTGIALQIRRTVTAGRSREEIAFPSDAEIASAIRRARRIGEIEDGFRTLYRAVADARSGGSAENIIQKVVAYANANYERNLKLESLAELFGYNSAYLGKVFKSSTGENFHAFLDRIRIERAKELLREERLKVYEVSERVGYGNLDAFYRKFRQHEGLSPSDYRRSIGIQSDG